MIPTVCETLNKVSHDKGAVKVSCLVHLNLFRDPQFTARSSKRVSFSRNQEKRGHNGKSEIRMKIARANLFISLTKFCNFKVLL